jgi:Uma2 family endonuclease
MPMGLPSAKMTASEYLAWEREQLERHEFYRGEVFAMAGGSTRHAALAAAIIGELRVGLRGSDCRPLTSDQRVAVTPSEHYVYPDVSVVCGPVELVEGTNDVLRNPQVIIEVLSRSTEAYDRGDKWAGYRQIVSLREYVLISQALARIEVYRREQGGWRYEAFEAGERVTIAGVELDVDAIYEAIFELPGD